MKQFVRDNGGILTVMGVFSVIILGYIEWRVSENVDTELQDVSYVTTEQFEAFQNNNQTNQEAIKEDVAEVKNLTNRMLDILLAE